MSRRVFSTRTDWLRAGIIALATTLLLLAGQGQRQSTAEDFKDLVAKVPSGANTIVVLNMEKVRNSRMGAREGWSKSLAQAHADGLFVAPPQATRFVLASQLDFEFVEPLWEAAVVETGAPVTVEEVVLSRGGVLDTLEGRTAAALSNDTYVVQLGPQLLCGMGPANRQVVLQWMRQLSAGQSTLSPYLAKAGSFSDTAGTEIILAADLAGALAPQRVENYLGAHADLLKQAKVEPKAVADLLAGIQGIRLGIRIAEQPTARLAVDFNRAVSLPPEFVKQLLLTVLGDAGVMIDDLNQWTPQVSGTEASLSGTFTKNGLRRVTTLISSPAPSMETKEREASPSDSKNMGKATLARFQAVTGLFDDLKQDWRDMKSLAHGAVYFDKYARKIEQMPILNVDPEMLDYSQFVAEQMRAASGAVRTMGVRGGVRESQVTAPDAGVYSSGYGYGGYRYGAYGSYGGYYSPREQARDIGAERRRIQAQEKGVMAGNVSNVRDEVIAATNDIRRKMTQKYQMEF